MEILVRAATADDAKTIHQFICDLAAYERNPGGVECTPETLAEQMREPSPPFECLIAEQGTVPVGFALFFHNYSTWRGRRGIYLEDLFVPPRLRGRGIGLALITELARVARDRNCPRMDWSVLDWNRPSIEFYEKIGAYPLDEWTTFRLDGQALAALADRGA